MLSENIRPSTIEGIKRLANSIKKERGIKHLIALDEVARLAGFENFRHAGNVLPPSKEKRSSVRPQHRVFLTVYWREKKTDARGRETLELNLDTPWSELILPAQLENHRALVHFRPEGPDHLARPDFVDSQSRARYAICAAARTLQFMDATKLRPSKSFSRVYPGGRSSNAVPAHDHDSSWYDRETKRYLYADEPYEEAVKKSESDRAAWAQEHGFTIARPSWPGMYYPDGGSRLYLIADSEKGIPLAPIMEALNRLPAPITEETWNGESAPCLPYFVSPGSRARPSTAKPVPAKPRQAITGKRSTVDYVRMFVGPQRRPDGRMPIEAHAKAGELLKSVLVHSHHRKGVYNRVDGIRCELDEWVMREYTPTELPGEQFSKLYYHESGRTYQRTISIEDSLRHVDGLNAVKRLLTKHYPDSSPLRILLKKADEAIKSMETWAACRKW